MTPVDAGPDEMSLEKQIKSSIASAKNILNRVTSAKPVPPPVESPRKTVIEEDNESDEPTDNSKKNFYADRGPVVRSPSDHTYYIHKCDVGGPRRIVTPAGLPPVKPAGYKQRNWPNGPASDEVIQNWAREVYASDGERYAVEAVIYWARYFWDINGPEFKRVSDLILATLAPNRQII